MSEGPWKQPPIYVEARDRLDAVVLGLGFKRQYERFDYFAFGSIFAIYERARGPRVSVGWDGKDACLYVSIAADGAEHNRVFESSVGLDRESENSQTASIHKLVNSVRTFLTS